MADRLKCEAARWFFCLVRATVDRPEAVGSVVKLIALWVKRLNGDRKWSLFVSVRIT